MLHLILEPFFSLLPPCSHSFSPALLFPHKYFLSLCQVPGPPVGFKGIIVSQSKRLINDHMGKGEDAAVVSALKTTCLATMKASRDGKSIEWVYLIWSKL